MLILVSMFFIIQAGNGLAAESCVCLDVNGIPYEDDVPEDSLCYTCTEEGCLENGLTFSMCQSQSQPQSEALSEEESQPQSEALSEEESQPQSEGQSEEESQPQTAKKEQKKAKPTEVSPTEVPPTEVPPTEVPPTPIPPTEVPPTEVPPTEVPPTEVPPTEVPYVPEPIQPVVEQPAEAPIEEQSAAAPAVERADSPSAEEQSADVPQTVESGNITEPEGLNVVPGALQSGSLDENITEAGEGENVGSEEQTSEAEEGEGVGIVEQIPEAGEGEGEGSEEQVPEAGKGEDKGSEEQIPEAGEGEDEGAEEQTPAADEDGGEGGEEQTPAADEDEGEAGEEQTPAADEDECEGGEEQTPAADEDEGEGGEEQTPAADEDEGDGGEEKTPAPDENEGEEEQTPAPDENEGEEEQTPAPDENEGEEEQTPAPDENEGEEEQFEDEDEVPEEESPSKKPKKTAEPKKKSSKKTPTPTPTPTSTPAPKRKKITAPKAPVQECPIGRYTVRSLGFYWAPSKNAKTYIVRWWNDHGQEGTLSLSNSDKTCQKGRCIAYASLPGTGNYEWTVTASNKAGSATSGKMKFEIASNISVPTAYSPNGTIVNRIFPAFQWEDVEDGAIAYRIQVIGKYDNRIRLDSWYPVKDIYVGEGVCYVKTDLFLPAGTYSWRVQAKNDDFCSGWSSWLDFYVECDYCNYSYHAYQPYTNTVPRTSYPAGVITNLSPEFQWQTLTGASYYMVKLTDSAGNQLFDRQVYSSSCTLELCTFNPNFKLPGNGIYYWTVSGYGSTGGLWGSSSGSFEVRAEIVLNPINFISPEPNGYLSQESPVIIWSDPGETTVLFGMEIYDRDNNSLFTANLNREQAWCDGTTCSIAFQSIPDAEGYRITLTPYSELNTKGDQASLVFNKGAKPIKLTSPKDGSVVQARPMFRWTLENGDTAEYELILIDEENYETVYSPLVCGSDGVNCEDGEAFFSPAEELSSGVYTASLGIVGLSNASVFGFTVE